MRISVSFQVKMELMGGTANNVATPFPVASVLSILFYSVFMKNNTLHWCYKRWWLDDLLLRLLDWFLSSKEGWFETVDGYRCFKIIRVFAAVGTWFLKEWLRNYQVFWYWFFLLSLNWKNYIGNISPYRILTDYMGKSTWF